MSRIRITIDSVALQGFDPAERTALVEGLKSGLMHALSSPASGSALRSRRTPVVRLADLPRQPGPSGSRAFGNAVARAIGRSVKP